MARVQFHNFAKGLWVISGKEQTLPGFIRRARGMNAIRTPSLRSRYGSTQLYGGITAIGLFRYNDVRFAASATTLYRNGLSIKSGLNGGMPTFVPFPPQPAVFDSLFALGMGSLIKIDSGGGITNWGIAAPSGDFTAAPGVAGALTGTYQYYITFKNLTTGSRSNPNPHTQIVSLTAQKGALSGIPISPDPQVNAREIWRTVSGGGLFFLVDSILDNTTTTYIDNITDVNLQNVQLPFDNIPPGTDLQDAWGPYAGCMWWGRSNILGNQGRVYYSPVGRPESVSSFIDLVNPDDPTQKGLVWNASNYVFTQKRLIQILGDTAPWQPREVNGVPGTIYPFTVVPTPYGIAYAAIDGVRLFDGTVSNLLAPDALLPIFRGEALENLNAFTPLVATYARDEYFISDGVSQTIAVNLKDGSWRDMGVGATALYQEKNTRHLLASFGGNIYSLEDWLVYQDGANGVPLEWEIGGTLSDIAQNALIQRLFIDINTNGQSLTPILVVDGAAIPLASFSTPNRQEVEYSIGQPARLFGLRLTGTPTQQVELFGVEMDAYWSAVQPSPGR